MNSVRLALLLAIAVAGLMAAPSVWAQGGLTVTDDGVENRFPDEIVFRVSTQSDSPIERIRLRYTVLPDGTAAVGAADFLPGTAVSASFSLEGNSPPRIYLAPGTTIEYRWEVTDAEGETASTETATFFYNDIRFDWTPLEENGVTVYFYSGSEGDARAMLAVARETITSMSELLGTSIDFPLKVWIYRSVNDMRPALQRRSETYEQSVITAGARVASDTVLVLGNASFDTLRHELTHVVTAVAGEGPFGNLPAWLNEGTAVYSQASLGGYGGAIDRAADRGNLFSIRSISSYQGDPNLVNLFYGQSWSLVSYLVDTYGSERFAQLFAEIKGGKGTDQALMAVYGIDQDGLEDEWRASLGLAPLEEPEPQPTDAPPLDVERREEDDGGTSVAVILAVLLATLALAGVVALAGWTLARRMR